MNRQMTAWAQGKGLRQTGGNTWAGLLGGIPVSIKKQNKSVCFYLSVQTDARQASAFSGQMTRHEPAFGVLRIMSEGSRMVVLCTPKRTLTVRQMDQLTDTLLGAAQAAGMVSRACCEICGQPVNAVVLRDGHLLVVCDRCASDEKRNIGQGSFPAGLTGALLGAVTGGAFQVLLTLTSGFYMGYLSVLTAPASFAGYRLLGGRCSRRAAFLCVLFSTLLTGFAAEAACYLPSYHIQEIGETVQWYMQSVRNGDEAVIFNGLVALLCALAGVVVSFFLIKREIFDGRVRELARLRQSRSWAEAAKPDVTRPHVLTRR